MRRPSTPSRICCRMPHARLPSIAARFHIASVTVRPNPSWIEFCTTTDEQRCKALTISSFSLRTAIGSEMSAMSDCKALGSATYAAVSSRSTSCASGSSATAAGSGPASTSRTISSRRPCRLPAPTEAARSFKRMKPSSSGLNPFKRSHREIWVTIGRKSSPTPPLSFAGAKLPSGASRVATCA